MCLLVSIQLKWNINLTLWTINRKNHQDTRYQKQLWSVIEDSTEQQAQINQMQIQQPPLFCVVSADSSEWQNSNVSCGWKGMFLVLPLSSHNRFVHVINGRSCYINIRMTASHHQSWRERRRPSSESGRPERRRHANGRRRRRRRKGGESTTLRWRPWLRRNSRRKRVRRRRKGMDRQQVGPLKG